MSGENTWDLPAINKIGDYLQRSKQTIAVAESVTAGYLQVALSLAENASYFFQGGITTYTIPQKTIHLGVDNTKAMACNGVSYAIAAEMALGATRLFQSDWGIGITGYATPVPESGNALFAFFSVFNREREIVTQKITHAEVPPLQIRMIYTETIIRFLSNLYSNMK